MQALSKSFFNFFKFLDNGFYIRYIDSVIGYVRKDTFMTTIKDVASKAGVSTATVSRIINGKGEASPETIKKVMKIVEELSYRPSSVAKSLSKRESNLIALLIPNLNNPFFSELVQEIEHAANKKGYQIYLCNSEDDRQKVEYYLETMMDLYVAGAIINSLHVTEEDLSVLEQRNISTVTIDRAHFSHQYSAFEVDHVKGSYIATEHLIKSCNCTNFLFISGPKDEKSSNDRYKGYLNALNAFNGTHVKRLYGNFDIESGYVAIKNYLEENNYQEINGIVSSNDAMALGAIRAFKDKGINIPDEIKIIGYDNTNNGRYSVPRLSSVSQFNSKTAEMIITEIDHLKNIKKNRETFEISPELITRESTTTNK